MLLAGTSFHKKHLWVLFFLNAAILTLNCLGLFSREVFADMAIIFEGGYRIFLGQVPYRDFFIPTGPIVFYLQAFFDRIFGPNLWAMALHAGTLAGILASFFYLLTVKKWGMPLSIAMAISVFFSYIGLFNYPWYNQTAYFFFLGNMMLLLSQINRSTIPFQTLIASGLLTFLSLFSKQDVGLLHFFLLTLFFFWHSRFNFGKCFIGYILPVLLVTAAAVAAYQSMGNFVGCFSLGGGAHSSRLTHFLHPGRIYLFFTWRFLGILACAYFTLNKKLAFTLRARFFLLGILILVPFITSLTSGTGGYTVWQGFPLILYLVYDILDAIWPATVMQYQKWIFFLLIASTLICLQPVNIMAKYIGRNLSMLSGKESLKAIFKTSELVRIPSGSYQHGLIRRGYYEDLLKIRSLLESRKGKFFNMSEYTFLYPDFHQLPPVGYPLWFDYGVSFAGAEMSLLQEGLIQKRPALILLQQAVEHEDPQPKESLLHYYKEHGYHEILQASAPVDQKKIAVLFRKELSL